MFTLEDAEHDRLRKNILPYFRKKIVDSYFDDLMQCCLYWVGGLQVGKQISLPNDAKILSVYVVNRIVFGVDDFAQQGALGDECQDLYQKRLALLDAKTKPEEALARDVIEKYSEQLYAEMQADFVEYKHVKQKAQAIFPKLCQSKRKSLTADEIVSTANSAATSELEGLSVTLCWALFLLALNPAAMDRLAHDIRSVKEPTLVNIENMGYLDWVIKEALRILPSSPILGRVAMSDTHLNGFLIPQHTEILVSSFITHHTDPIYAEPRKFIPERWETIKPKVSQYLPFGMGAHFCVGYSLTILQMKIVLFTLLRHFNLELGPNQIIDWRVRISLFPIKDIIFTLKEKNTLVQRPSTLQGSVFDLIE